MKIVEGLTPSDCAERVDVAAGAVIFDPWPFEDCRVILKNDVLLWDGSHLEGPDSEDSRGFSMYEDGESVLAFTTQGRLVVMAQSLWHGLAREGGAT